MNELLSFIGGLSGNNLLGWLFIGFGFASLLGIGIDPPNITHALLWLVLAKLCWIHADIKER